MLLVIKAKTQSSVEPFGQLQHKRNTKRKEFPANLI